MYTYQTLENVEFNKILDCFNQAFQDYYIPFKLSENQLRMRFKLSLVDLSCSFGAFYSDQLVGFIFNSCSEFNNRKVVFDVGTGVIPEHRSKHVLKNLLAFSEPKLKEKGIEEYYLEVLQPNEKAIKIYEKYGFKITRSFSVLKVSQNNNITFKIDNCELKEFNLNQINHCLNIKPSYENSTNIIMSNQELFEVAYKINNNQISAYCIYSSNDGSIAQLGYSSLNDLKKVILSLLNNYDEIIIKNLDLDNQEVYQMLIEVGFKELVKQYEMVKILKGD